jgi:hypothetical protein
MKVPLVLLVIALAVAGCASTEYLAYEGRNAIREGQGGTKRTIDGVDFWETGEPPRRFQILGVINDDRPDAPLPRMQRNHAIAKLAKAQGGNAVMLLSQDSKITGYVNTGVSTAQMNGNTMTAVNTGGAQAVRRASQSLAVVKYLD